MDRYDIYAQFAQHHLSSPAEQAVYAALVSHPDRLWCTSDLAAQAALAPATLAPILRQHAAAGIVEDLETANRRRYRWCADLRYCSAPMATAPLRLTRCVTCRSRRAARTGAVVPTVGPGASARRCA
jgi:hypothetical protein